jgi:hypothetical protein
MTRRAIKPGTKFKDVFTSKFINELTQPPQESVGGQGYPFALNSLIVYCSRAYNSPGVPNIDAYDPVLILGHGSANVSQPPKYNTSSADPEIVPEIALNICAVSEWTSSAIADNPSWGISLDRITPETGPGRVLLTGVTYLKLLNTVPTTNRNAYTGIDIRRGQMIYGVTGRAEILGNLEGNQSHVLVNLSRRTQSAVTGITVNAIPPNSAGTVNIEIPGGAVDSLAGLGTYQGACWNPHRTKAVNANRRVVAVDVAGKLVIVFEECP